MAEKLIVDYGPHYKPGDCAWEVHLQACLGSPRYQFQAGCSNQAEAQREADRIASTFRDDTVFTAVDSARKVIAVKFMTA